MIAPVEPSRGLVDFDDLSDEELGDRFDDAAELVQQSSDDALSALAGLADAARARRNDALAARCDYLAARANVNLGRLEPALRLIDRAQRGFVQAGLLVEAARTDLGRMHVLDDLGRHREAVAVGHSLLQRIPVIEAAGAADGLTRLEAAAHENLGVSHGYLGSHADALAAYEVAERAYRQGGFVDETVRCTANRGVELIELGRSDEAIVALEPAGSEFAREGDLLSAAKCSAYAARAHLQLGNYLAAVDATSASELMLSGQETTVEYARTQLVRAETLASLNLVDDALELYVALEQQFDHAGLEHDHAMAVIGRAALMLRSGRAGEAHELFGVAVGLFDAVGDRPMRSVAEIGRSYGCPPDDARRIVAGARVTLVELGRRADEVAAGLRLVELSSGDEADRLLDECDEILRQVELPHLAWQMLRERARLLRERGDAAGALDALQRAAVVVESLRTTVADERGRIPFLGTRRVVHDDIVALMLDMGDVDGACAYVGAARARTLVERSAELEASVSAALRAPSPVRPEVAADEPAGVVLTFEILGDEVLAFLRWPGRLTVHRRLTTVSRVHHLLARLDAQWRRFEDRSLAARQERALTMSTVDVLQRLYLELLGPMPELLDASSVAIVPIGVLTNVPFNAMHDGTCHLIERFSLALVPSERAATLAGQRRRVGNRRLVVGVADRRAPRIADEVDAIALLDAHSTMLRSDAATAVAFAAAANDHDLLHLACHGVNRPDNPMLSALALADRWLTALEISELELDGQLVVLSACESGRQHSIGNADEMMGLPRAFLAAGASGVVVNLWRADDAAASELMADFHRNLSGSAPVAALRSAQLEMLERRPHPYLWAPTIAYIPVDPGATSGPAKRTSVLTASDTPHHGRNAS